MIPEHRLATLLTEVQNQQIMDCKYHNTTQQPSLYTDHECSIDDFPTQTMTELRNHADEVWFVAFSHNGKMLATAGKDGLVCIYDTTRWKILHEFREHERAATGAETRGVVYVAFSPDDRYLISCSQNNEFVVVSLQDGRRVATADHFDYPVTTAAWLPDSQTFVVGTQGSRRPLGLYSLRSSNGNNGPSIVRNNELHSFRSPPWDPTARDNQASFRISDCDISRDGTRLIASTLENKILLFDIPTRYRIAEWQMEDKVSSIKFSADGEEVLVSMNEGRVMEVHVATGEVIRRFEGVVQREFVVRSCYGGAGEGFVVSGSEGMFLVLANSVLGDDDC
jgi:WD40 repeat protein